jgi:hypothetical protein
VALRAEGLLLENMRDNMKQAGTVPRDAGELAGAWDEPIHEQPQRGEQSSKTRHDPGTGGRDAGACMVAGPYPHMLHRQRSRRSL